MLINSEGLIVRSVKYGESSLIIKVYTRAKGMRSYIISGVRKKNARFAPGLLQVMNLVELVAYHRDDADLTRIKEIRSNFDYDKIPFDISRSSVGLFMVEVLSKAIGESEANEDLYKFQEGLFQYLDQTNEGIGNIPLFFLLGLSFYLGISPGGNYGENTPYFNMESGLFTNDKNQLSSWIQPPESGILGMFMGTKLSELHKIIIRKKTRISLLDNLIKYYQIHLDYFPPINSVEILKQIFQ